MAGGIIGNLMFAVGFKVADSALRKAEKQTQQLEENWKKVGLAATAVAAGIGIVGKKALSAATDYEKSMLSIQTMTGMTAAQMEETKGIATELYNQNLGESWDDLGASISMVSQITKQHGDELKETTRAALLYSQSFKEDFSESIKTADTMAKQFGITNEEAFNLLAQGQQKGLNKSGDLMDTANEYANQFKALGFNANEMFDTLAVGGENGAFNLDKVGDAVKEFNIRAKDGSNTTVEAFEMLGLNADKMMGVFAAGGPQAKKSFQDIMSMLADIEDPAQRNTIGVALMGSQFEDLEATTITALGTARSQFDMTADKMNELNQIKLSTPGEAADRIGRQFETGIMIPLGQKLMPYLNQFSQWLQNSSPQILQFGGSLVDGIGKGIQFITSNISVLLPVVGALITAFVAYKAIMMTITVVTRAMLMYQQLQRAAMVAYRVTVTAVTAVSKAWTIAQTALNVVLSLNPIGLIVIAVAALVAAFVIAYKKSETFRNVINKVWESIKIAFFAVMNFFTTTVPAVFNNIVGFIKQWGPIFLLAIMGPVGLVVGLVIKYWDEIKTWTVNTWNNIVNRVSTAATSIWTKISNIWNQITGFLKGINLFDIGKNIIDGLVNGISSMAGAVVDKIKDIGSSITDKVKGILGIHSPSRVMMEVGFFTGEGLAQGIENTQGRVAAASEGMTEEVTPQAHQATSPARVLAPARTPSAGAGSGGRMEISVNIDLRANASDAGVAQDVGAEVRRQVQAIVEQTFRRMGLPTPEVTL